MAEKVVTTVTCDACKKLIYEEDSTDDNTGIDLANVFGAVFAEKQKRTYLKLSFYSLGVVYKEAHLCSECRDKVIKWIEKMKEEDENGDELSPEGTEQEAETEAEVG